jgi:hypothetical protein
MKKLLFVAALGLTFITGCRKVEMDAQTVYITQPGNPGTGVGQTITLRGTITTDSTLRKGNNYILSGLVFIEKGATLNIEAGVTVKGEYSGANVAGLIIKRGAKINAKGTASEPIVFTSNSPNPASGDWAGIVLLGTARINTTTNSVVGLYSVEGGINDGTGRGIAGSGDAAFPTPNDDDNSGVMQYVRIEYAGYAFQPDNEINSLTLACVGRGTTIDHIEVMYAKDDAYEWFGGTVNCKYLIAYKTQDDDFDSDNGYSGQVQFGLIVRDSSVADVSNSEAFESDNNSGGAPSLPRTAAIFSNCTLIGPRATINSVGNTSYLAAVQIRRNSGISLYNTVIMGWGNGVEVSDRDGTATSGNIGDSTLRMKNVLIAGCNNPLRYVVPLSGTPLYSLASLQSYFASGTGNRIVSTVDSAGYTRPFNYTSYDFTPFGNATSLLLNNTANPNNASFTDTKLAAAVATTQINKIEVVNFRGAIAPASTSEYANWYKGWTKF